MASDEIKVWFDSAVDLLISHGNRIENEHYGSELSSRWKWDKEGGHCVLTKPLDLKLIGDTLIIPQSVVLDHKYGMIRTIEEYLDVKQRVPIHFLPGFMSPKTDTKYIWSPLKIFEETNPISLSEVKELLLNNNAEFIGDRLDVSKYAESSLENYKQGTWTISNSQFSKVYFFYEAHKLNDFTSGHISIGLLKSTHDQEKEITDLIDYLKPLAQNLQAKLWNDQYQEWVQIN